MTSIAILPSSRYGTRFGSPAATPTRSHDMTGSMTGPGASPTPRQRDRRQALGELLTNLTRTLKQDGDVSLMRGAFEQTLRHVVPVRTVQLRDQGSRWTDRPAEVAGA